MAALPAGWRASIGVEARATTGFVVEGYRRVHHRQWDGLVVRACLLALAVMVGGCSGSELVQNLEPSPLADLPQPNYRRIVASNIKTLFPAPAAIGDLEISGVRLVDHVKGPAWVTCLKFHVHVDPVVGQSAPNSTTTENPVVAQSAPSPTASGSPQYYAIFIQGDKIIDARLGVAIDQCRSQTFQPFDLSPPATAKNR